MPDIIEILLAVTIGRLVLDLPKEDCKKINEIIKQNLANKEGE